MKKKSMIDLAALPYNLTRDITISSERNLLSIKELEIKAL